MQQLPGRDRQGGAPGDTNRRNAARWDARATASAVSSTWVEAKTLSVRSCEKNLRIVSGDLSNIISFSYSWSSLPGARTVPRETSSLCLTLDIPKLATKRTLANVTLLMVSKNTEPVTDGQPLIDQLRIALVIAPRLASTTPPSLSLISS